MWRIKSEWRFLAYLNWTVAPDLLEAWVPAGWQLHPWEGAGWISVVAGRCLKPRLFGLPVLTPEGFSRVGWQTYVRRGDEKAVLSLGAIYSMPALATLLGSRSKFGAVSKSIEWSGRFDPGESGSEGHIRYAWGSEAEVAITTEGPPVPAEMWPDEAFFLERFLYVTPRGKISRLSRPGLFVWDAPDSRLSAPAAADLPGLRPEWVQAPPAKAFLVKGGPVMILS